MMGAVNGAVLLPLIVLLAVWAWAFIDSTPTHDELED